MKYGTDVHGTEWFVHDGYRACRYCGSMHPDELFAAIEAGAMVTGTDKNYKIYVEPAHPDPDGARVIGASDRKPDYGTGWVEVTDENRESLGWAGRYKFAQIGKNGRTAHLKFYFEHLDEAAQQRFIDLYNEKKINLEPHFGLYVAPFFTRFGKKE